VTLSATIFSIAYTVLPHTAQASFLIGSGEPVADTAGEAGFATDGELGAAALALSSTLNEAMRSESDAGSDASSA